MKIIMIINIILGIIFGITGVSLGIAIFAFITISTLAYILDKLTVFKGFVFLKLLGL